MFPIVLVHGIARFDFLTEMLGRIPVFSGGILGPFQYFRNIARHLIHHGFTVFSPNLNFAGRSALRAAQLATAVESYLEKTGASKIHLVAHSMGGLDARRMIVDEPIGRRVASLTTIGTPHHGTILADRLIENGGGSVIAAVKRVIKLDLTGLHDLTTSACARFDRLAAKRESGNEVLYQTYASSEEEDRIFSPLLPSHRLISKEQGVNDGFVPVSSQRWVAQIDDGDGGQKPIVQKTFPFPADHLNQIGWWDWEEREDLLEFADPIKQRREYEEKVRAVYLEIAQSVQHL